MKSSESHVYFSHGIRLYESRKYKDNSCKRTHDIKNSVGSNQPHVCERRSHSLDWSDGGHPSLFTHAQLDTQFTISNNFINLIYFICLIYVFIFFPKNIFWKSYILFLALLMSEIQFIWILKCMNLIIDLQKYIYLIFWDLEDRIFVCVRLIFEKNFPLLLFISSYLLATFNGLSTTVTPISIPYVQ